MKYLVTTFYKFTRLKNKELLKFKEEFTELARGMGIFGLIVAAKEGVNATITGEPEKLEEFKKLLAVRFGELNFKDSPADRITFKRFKVSIRKEIVQLQRTDIQPSGNEAHISPEEWDKMIAEENVTLIDVRNWYETIIGSFKGAIDPKTFAFSQFPKWVKKSDIPKDKKVGIFCTGGIRCEKAAVAMEEQGYTNVVQLDGGILNYIEKRPDSNYKGECFVFDHRLAVKQNLEPSERYGVCPHCGNGGDVLKSCSVCESEYRTCGDCLSEWNSVPYCSKRCRNGQQLNKLKNKI